MKCLFNRNECLDELITLADKNLIIAITGIRGCGKTTLLQSFRKHLLQLGLKESQLVTIDFEDYACRTLLDADALVKFVAERMSGARTCVFLDEFQHLRNWPAALAALSALPRLDLYLISSSSITIPDSLRAKFAELKLQPLSFKEFSASENSADRAALYHKYLRKSSFPGAQSMAEEDVRSFLTGIYTSIVVNDIVYRSSITDIPLFESVLRFIFEHLGEELSAKSIAASMSTAGLNIDVRTAQKYINALVQSFILCEARRYDVKKCRSLRTGSKFYAADPALITAVLGSKPVSADRILENLVYLELLRRGYEVFAGKSPVPEINFVATKNFETVYYQIASSVRAKELLQLKLTPLQKIKDNYPKFILTLDDDPAADYGGIRRINALDWFLEN